MVSPSLFPYAYSGPLDPGYGEMLSTEGKRVIISAPNIKGYWDNMKIGCKTTAFAGFLDIL